MVTLKQFFGNLPTNSFSVFDHFVKLAQIRLILEVTNDWPIIGIIRNWPMIPYQQPILKHSILVQNVLVRDTGFC